MIRAVLFDFDGVLVNSMPFHVRAWRAACQGFGVEIPAEHVLMREGARCVEVARELAELHKLALTRQETEDLAKKKQEIYREVVQLDLDEHVEPLLHSLANMGLRAGLVTGSPLKHVELLLPPRIRSLFDVIVTADEVRIGKPDPECYLKAARYIEVLPDSCLVIENAPLGIRAACAAGMRVVALTTTLRRSYLAQAHVVLQDLEELSQQLDTLLSVENMSLS